QNYMLGTVTSFNSGTGALAMSVASDGGSCGNSSSSQSPSNCKRWLVSTVPQTVIINNSSSTIFSVTEDSSFNTRLGNFKIQEGTGGGDGVDFIAGGGKAIVLHDCWIEQGSGDSVHTAVNRGLIYNCSFDSTPFSMAPLAIHLQPYDTSAWSTPSFWGASDTGGTHNFYLEKCVFAAYLNAEDNDEGARSVSRYSTFDNAGYGTHGADTSPIGQRYFEYYENVGVFNGYNDGTTFDMVWWFFVRGGTYVIWGNTLPALTSTDYGTKAGVNMTVMNLQRNTGTETSCWGAGFTSGGQFYHAPRQVGMGYVTGLGTVTYSLLGLVNAVTTTVGGYTAYVGDSEPAYIWGNSNVPLNNVGTSDYGGGGCTNPDTSANYIKLGRDYFNGSTVKPGYSPYQYPHPLEQDNQVVGSGPAAPTGLIANVQ
ncbi:MAG: hypothetical protein ACRD5K_17710, partial [Candidatus Acidiferrales bacterium]